MAEQKRKSRWDATDANGYDWNSGEEFDPDPSKSRAVNPQQAAPAQQQVQQQQTQPQQAAPASAGVGYVQTPNRNPASASYLPTPAWNQPSAQGFNLSGLATQAAQVAQNSRAPYVDTARQEQLYGDIRDRSIEQSNASIDRAVTQGINALQNTREEAEGQYRTMRNQIDADEARARDNQALRNAAQNGGASGVGNAQLDAIAATAMQNRYNANNAWQSMATNLSLKALELKNQGEYEKMNAVNQIMLQYSQQMAQLDQWAQTTNRSVDEFNAQLQQWAVGVNAQLAQLGLEAWQWQQSFDRNVLESDRAYNRGVLESDRAYNRNVLESDRNYNRGVYESDRAFGFQERQYNDALQQQARENEWKQQQIDLQVRSYEDSLRQQALENGWKQQEVDLQVRAYEDGLRQQAFSNNLALRQADLETAKFNETAQNNAWERNQTEQQTLYNQGLTSLQNGVMPSESQLRALDMPRENAQELVTYVRAQRALGLGAAVTVGDDGKISIGGTSGAGSAGSFDEKSNRLYADAKASGNPKAYITNNYKRYGFTSSSGLYDGYQTWTAGGGSLTGGGMSYEDARKEADAGVWSDAIFSGLQSGGMSVTDIIRKYGGNADDDDEMKDPYRSRFWDYFSGNGIPDLNYNRAKISMQSALNGKNLTEKQKVQSVQNTVNSMWPSLSRKQQFDLLDFLDKYNIELN